MTARVITIGKHTWVAGLSWLSYDEFPRKSALLEDASQLKSSWVAVRNGQDAIQGGFCAPIEGVKNPTKLRSLAAHLADSQKQPWLGIFELGEGLYWYIAVRDHHAILPDGDVIGDFDTVFAAREGHLGYGDWNPIEGGLALLQDMMADIDVKPPRLKSLTSSNFTPAVATAAAALTVVAIGAGAYHWWHGKKVAEEQARQAAIQRVRDELAAKKPVVSAPASVPALPSPADWLEACGRVLRPLPLSKHGWVVDQVGCDQTSAVVRWAMSAGADVTNRPQGEVSDQGDTIQERISLASIKPREGDDVIDLSDAKIAIRAWTNANGMQAPVFAAPAQAPALPGAQAPQAPAAPKQAAVALETGVSPLLPRTMRELSNLPGLRLTLMKQTEAGWHVEGVVYGR